MFMKKKIVPNVLCIAAGLLCLYTGISCIATLCRAASQPYLSSGAVRIDFMGFYILAAINGVVCILSALLLLFLSVRMKRAKKAGS